MSGRRRPALAAVVLAAALVVGAAPAHAGPPRPPAWEAVELGTLGGARTVPTAVNDHGVVVGRSELEDGRWHAFRWEGGVMTDLSPDAQDGTATDVSNAGDVSGWVQPGPGEPSDAVLWRDGTTTVLAEDGIAALVNERGQVGGSVAKPETWSDNPFVWRGGVRTDLAPPPFPESFPNAAIIDLNRRGQVLARGEFYDDTDLAYVWTAGTFTELRADGLVVRGTDLDDRGRVVGTVNVGGGATEAAMWRDGGIVRLGVLPGTTMSRALALNDDGLVVGASGTDPRQGGTAFVWHRGTMRALTPVGDGWSVASAVNERGQVAGQLGRTTADGEDVAQPFVWQRGRLRPLGTATADDVTVVDLSEKGHVVTVTGDFLSERGVLWVPKGRR